LRISGGAALGLAASLAGCVAAGWSLRVSQPQVALQWPYLPSVAKVSYERSLGGFSRARTAGSLLRAVVWGGAPVDADAFVLPVAVAAAADGRLAVADAGRSCVHLFTPQARRYLRLTGTRQAPMRSPVAVAFDGEGGLWVSDSTGRLYVYGSDGAPRRTVEEAGGGRLQRPTGLAWSPARRTMYVVDTLAHSVVVLDARGDFVTRFGRRGEAAGEFNYPTHIAWASGTLYVTDSLNFRVQTFDEEGHALGGFGKHGDGSGDLAMPKGVAVDRDGVVYVADAILDNVQLFDRSGAFLLTLGRRGSDFGEFWLPSGLFLGAGGELYVCDTYNRRVQVFRVTEGYEQPAS
jgi:DNA-binding beta-propeller fold protein YncE